MSTATITQNGMIHLPAEIRKTLDLSPGDKIRFVHTENGIIVVPIKKLSELIMPENKEAIEKMVRELLTEHKHDAERGL